MGKDLKISICIPAWEQHGYGKQYLQELLDSIQVQTYTEYNVVISDHSINNEIEELVKEYETRYEIVYIKNEKKRGNGPANTNVSLKNATGDIIKVMFQDDLFVNNDALEKIAHNFKNYNTKWLVSGCNHTNDGKTFYREMIPRWNDKIIEGVNTISSPSVLSFINKNVPYFDEELVMLMDCEFYYQLYKKYGLPIILDKILISNRTHSHQVSSQYTQDINEEISYVKNKHLW